MSDISIEDIALEEGLDYRLVSGSRGEQVQLRSCPLCGKESWKVYFGAESGLGNCFSCQVGFNQWSFVRALLGAKGGTVTSRDIGLYLDALRTKLGYRPKAKVAPKPIAAVSTPFTLPSSAALPYEDGWMHPYLLARGINGDYAAQFHLRYSSFGVNVYTNDQGATVKQSFPERIIIPVFDLDGTMVTYQGRDTTGLAQARYKFAGGLPGTARYLYNGHTAWASRASCGLLCEGPMDVIGAKKALDGAHDLSDIVPIGSFGMHLSEQKDGVDQLSAFRKLHKQGMTRVVIMWDGASPAYQAALNASTLLTKIGMEVAIATLPPGSDPGDADASVIQQAVRDAKPVTRLSLLRMKLNNPYSV